MPRDAGTKFEVSHTGRRRRVTRAAAGAGRRRTETGLAAGGLVLRAGADVVTTRRTEKRDEGSKAV